MTYDFNVATMDGEVQDDEARLTKERRLATYSESALLAAEAIERIFVMTSELKDSLAICDRIFQLAPRLRAPQGALIRGEPGSGLSTVAAYFTKSLPKSSLFDQGFGVQTIRLRASPTAGLIVSLLLRAVQYPFTDVRKGRLYTMRDIAFEAIQQKRTKLIFIEMGHLLMSQVRQKNPDMTETAASDMLNELIDVTKVGVVMLARNVLNDLTQVDKGLADRISVRRTLTHFADNAHWHGFIRAFVTQSKAFDLTVLDNAAVASKTHLATGGNKRSFVRLTTEAALIATDGGAKVATVSHLQQAYERVRGQVAQSNPYA